MEAGTDRSGRVGEEASTGEDNLWSREAGPRSGVEGVLDLCLQLRLCSLIPL